MHMHLTLETDEPDVSAGRFSAQLTRNRPVPSTVSKVVCTQRWTPDTGRHRVCLLPAARLQMILVARLRMEALDLVTAYDGMTISSNPLHRPTSHDRKDSSTAGVTNYGQTPVTTNRPSRSILPIFGTIPMSEKAG